MRVSVARHLAAIALIVIAAAAVGAQKPTVLFGVVRNVNGVRIRGVALTIANSTLQAITNDSGEFIFEAPPTGRVRLSARRMGFKPVEKGFKVDVGETKRIDFELEGVPEQLDSVLVTAKGGYGRMADFWTRRMIGVGAFITNDEIERRHPYRPSDMLRNLSGVRVDTDDGNGRPVIRMGRTALMVAPLRNSAQLAAACKVTYYMDGNYVPSGTFHIDDLSSMAIEAIEVFRGPAETPASFRQQETACGVISIWSKEPPARQKAEKADTVRTNPNTR